MSGRRSRQRFAIPQILEFYAATEGNFSLYNVEGKPGAIGRIPRLPHAPLSARHREVRRRRRRTAARRRRVLHRRRRAARPARPSARSPAARRVSRAIPTRPPPREEDPAQRVRAGRRLGPHRRPDAPGRAGLLLFRRPASATPSAGRARMSPPPKWPRRWPRYPGVTAANVYGVAVPGSDGKRRHGGAGSRTTVSICRGLHAHLATLPAYARPLFLRLVPQPGGHRNLQAEEAAAGGGRL